MPKLLRSLPFAAAFLTTLHFAACADDGTSGNLHCGNGQVDPGETCDDGNTLAGDGCSASCQKEPSTSTTCGDGKVDTGEACDDGNKVAGDGCENNCTKTAAKE